MPPKKKGNKQLEDFLAAKADDLQSRQKNRKQAEELKASGKVEKAKDIAGPKTSRKEKVEALVKTMEEKEKAEKMEQFLEARQGKHKEPAQEQEVPEETTTPTSTSSRKKKIDALLDSMTEREESRKLGEDDEFKMDELETVEVEIKGPENLEPESIEPKTAEPLVEKSEKVEEPEPVGAKAEPVKIPDNARQVMMESMKKKDHTEKKQATPAEKKKAEQVDTALKAAEQLYTGTRKVTRETLDFASEVGKGSAKLVSSVVGGAFRVVGWGLLGVVRVAGIGYRGAGMVTSGLGEAAGLTETKNKKKKHAKKVEETVHSEPDN